MHKKWQRLICTSIAVGLVSSLSFSSQGVSAATVTSSVSGFSATADSRLGGADQYETAAKIAEQGWSATSEAVVLAAGMTPNLVDALAAGPLSAKLKGPLLLTDGGDHLNTWAKQELQRLKPSKAFITSGTAVIKPTVLDELKGMGITPVELGGYDQYETSVNIAKEMVNQGVPVSQVVIAAGWVTPADALSIAPIAAIQGMPILATTRDALPASVRSFLDSLSSVTDSYIIGGSAVVGNTVQDQLSGTAHRYAGLTKYDTNIEVLKGFVDILNKEKTYVANGETLVDALAGVPLAAQSSSAILLTDQTLSAASSDYAKLSLASDFVALGGQAVVPQSVLEQVTVTQPTTPSSGGGGGTPSSSTIHVSNIKVITTPSNSLGSFGNGATIDMSSLPETMQVVSVSIKADQACDLQLMDETIPLLGGQATIINLDDIIPGTHGGNGISLKTFRALYGNSAEIQGELQKNGSVVGNLSITLKL